MFAHLIKGTVVNRELPIDTAQESACCAYLLYDEVANASDDIRIICRKYLLHRRITEGARDEI
jgi:hypothetical protein